MAKLTLHSKDPAMQGQLRDILTNTSLRPTKKKIGNVVIEAPENMAGEYITLKVADGYIPTKDHHLGRTPFGFIIVDSVTEGDGVRRSQTIWNANKVKFYRTAGTLADVKIWIF